MKETKPPLFLIDSYGLIYRSYFAFVSRPLRNAAGRNVSALFGFFRSLVSLLDDGAASGDGSRLRPARLAAVFDSRVPTFRHERYAEYKANRQKTPEDLHAQVPLVEEALAAMGIPAIREDRYEADDLIATLATRCAAEGRDCYIVSADKDLLQLVGDGCRVLRPAKAGAGYELVDADGVRAEWGVAPAQVLDVLALTGDASDNVPGVRGIGDKTATKLVARYGDLDGVYRDIAGIEGSAGRKLAEGKESAYFSRSLIELDRNSPLPIHSIEELNIETLDRAAGARVLHREGLRTVAQSLDAAAVKELESSGSQTPAAAAEAGSKAPARATRGDGLDQVDAAAATGPAPKAPGAVQGELFAVPWDGSNDFSGSAPAAVPDRGGAMATTGERSKRAATGKGADAAPEADERLREKGTYRALTDPPALAALVAEARRRRLVAFDFETDSLDAYTAKPVGFSLAVEPGIAYYVPLAPHPAAEGSTESGPRYADEAGARAALESLFMDPDVVVVAHNAKYDYKIARTWGIPRWTCRIWDTMVAAWIIEPERASYSLDALVASRIGLATLPYGEVVPKGATFDAVPLDTAVEYAAQDADFALRMKLIYEPLLQEAGQEKLFAELEMRLLPVLAEMEREGIALDVGALRAYGSELAESLRDLEAEIYRLVGHEFNIASTKQLQEVLFVERKLKATKKTKTGYSTDVGVLAELAREDPVPERILRYRTLAKLKSTYVDALPAMAGEDGRVRTHFVQTGTATGRISSKDPNLQNIPVRDEEGRRIRTAFVAGQGRLLVSADYSQIELVVLAHLSGDPGLLSAFKEGRDVHRSTAALIFGIAETAVTPEQRRAAKTINFGVMYGMSAFRLAGELGIPRSEAQAFIDAYFQTYAGVRDFIAKVVEETAERGYATTLLGRRRVIPGIRSSNKTERAAAERVAVNTPIQGSAADIVKLAMLRVDGALSESALDATLLLQVHDELILESAETDADAIMDLARREMEGAALLRLPLKVSVEKARAWGDMH